MSKDSIEIEYNRDLPELETLLSKVCRAGDYYAAGKRELPLPKVTIDGVGTLSFPLPPSQIERIVAGATKAPYGKGEQTILDESVRKVWQLAPESVQITGKSWPANFQAIVDEIAAGLGCEGRPVTAELYKLLVYDPGGFFRAHRDSEKVPGMFGTLVLTLPSEHTGGELIIRHAGSEARVELGATESSEIAYAGFYADCEHEVLPIRKGHRVCLVYNLIQKRKTGAHKSLAAPDYAKETARAATQLKDLFGKSTAPAKIVWLLEHQYTPDGLAFSALKSADAARAKVLAAAAEAAGCAIHLCLLQIEESGAAEPTYYGRSRRWHDGEEEEENDNDEDFEIIDIYEDSRSLSYWVAPDDSAIDFGEIPLESGELFPAGSLDNEKPDEQRFMEATGNEGGSFERSYRRAALAIWPRDRFIDILMQVGPDAAVPYLRDCIRSAAAKSAPPTAREAARETAERVVETWINQAQKHPTWSATEKCAETLRLLLKLGDRPLILRFIQEALIPGYDGVANAALIAAAPLLPAETLGSLYAALARQHMGFLHTPCIELLAELDSLDPHPPEPRIAALFQIAAAVVAGLRPSDPPEGAKRSNPWAYRPLPTGARPWDAVIVSRLLDLLAGWKATGLIRQAAEQIIQRREVFDPVSIVSPALALLKKTDAQIEPVWEHCAAFILARSEHPPAAPADWRREANLSCACAECRELRKFAENPLEQSHRFRVRKDRRQHLHQVIERHGLDMTHVTDRVGSPQTLVCTKTNASHERRCELYARDIAALRSLAKNAKKFSSPPQLLQRIKDAIDRTPKDAAKPKKL